MQKVKDSQSKDLYVVLSVIFLSLIILALLFLNLEKHKTINLNSANISVIDDRVANGKSVASFLPTNQGHNFTCQINKSQLAKPYCELIIDVQNLTKQAPFTGLDLSSYDEIGLWIKHNHATQPGTRIELRNFNPNYSERNNEKSLKHNTIEYLEAYVTSPVWLKLHSFSVPQWWNNLYNLAQTHGGTDFSNIYSIVIAPSKQIQEGSYKLTIDRIEVRGKYVSTGTLFALLAVVWSFALGYIIRRAVSPKPIEKATSTLPKQELKFGAMTDPLTGALNRIGLRKCFDQLAPTDLQNLSLIFLNIDYFENLQDNHGQPVADKVLKQFVSLINEACRSSDTIIHWESEEFLLVCPDTTLAQAVDVSDKMKMSIQEAKWPNGIKLSFSSGVAQMYDEDLNDLIARAKRALYSVKNTGSTKTDAA